MSKKLNWKLRGDKFSLRVVISDNLSKAVGQISDEFPKAKDQVIFADLQSIQHHCLITYVIIENKSDSWFKSVDQQLETIKRCKHTVVFVMSEEDYKRFSRLAPYADSLAQFYDMRDVHV